MQTQRDTHHRRTLNAIIVSGFFVTLGIGLLSFTLPLMSLDAKVSGSWLGTGFAGFFLARLLAGPLGGMWSDKKNPRMPLLCSTAMGAFTPLVYLAHPSIFTLYGVQFILGIISGLIRPVSLAVLGSTAQDNTHRWFSWHVFIFSGAMFLSPLLGGFLYWQRTIEPVLVVLSLFMVISNCIIFAWVPKEVTTQRLDRTSKQLNQHDRSAFISLLIAIGGRTFGLGLTIAFYPILLSVTLGVNKLLIGALFALPALVTCFGLPFGPVLKRRFHGDLILVGMMVSATGLMLVGISSELWHFVAAGIVMGFGAALSIPEAMSHASASIREQGTVFGATHVATGVGFVLGPLAGGIIVQMSGDVGYAFILSGLVGWSCLLVWSRFSLRKSSPKQHRISLVLYLIAMAATGGMWIVNSPDTQQEGYYRYTEIAMGTVINLTLVAESTKAADDAARKAMVFIRELQNDLDYRNPDGSVGRINAGAGKYYAAPTKRAYALIQRAVDFSRETGGVFDPTIGALTTSPLYYALDETIAESKKGLVDFRLVQLDEDQKRIRLAKKGMALDLGGIAKGTIIDATVKLLRGMGIRAGIVEAGGDFYCFGDRDWTIGIRHPRAEEVSLTVSVREQAVCGSGDYQQYVNVEKAGEQSLRHHIIDPSSMEPAHESLGVTVIAPSAELADSLATALFIMGPNKGRVFTQERFPDSAAMWYAPDLTVTTTNNFLQ
ncbi:MFS transporter [Pseudodesulfovibrio sp.]|nr:MFS transporter [Pseudodesulfovibrio sp.]